MKTFPVVAIVITILIVVGGVYFFSRDTAQTPVPAEPVSAHEYFWGEGCPYCNNVDDFLEEWEGTDQVEIEKKEIYQNQANARLLNQRAQSCGLSPNQIGVPFMYTMDRQCLIGDVPIIEFLESQVENDNSEEEIETNEE